ncbi:MAG: hypothetical protein ACYDHW_10790 [Syntrophorhabdaceae bacterium]
MKKLLIVVIGLFLLSIFGCSMAAHSVKDVDKHIVEMAAPDTASTECIAGFYSGIAFGTDNLKIAKAVTALDSLVSQDAPDYRRCKAKGLEVSILAISGKENLDDAIKRVMSLGLF